MSRRDTLQPLHPALQLAAGHHQAGRLELAERAYREVLSAEPDNPRALHLLGVLASQVGRHSSAAELIERSVQIDPDVASAQGALGNVQRELGRLDRAVECYRRALAIAESYAPAHYNLGSILRQRGERDEAIAHLSRALELNPRYALACAELGAVEQERGKLDEALAWYQRALDLDPELWHVLNNMGGALARKRELDRAITVYQGAIRLNPRVPELHTNLGSALQKQGDAERAIGSFESALSIRPDYWPARWQRFLALPLVYDSEDSILSWRRRWADNLQEIEARVDALSPAALRELAAAVMLEANFPLHYQGMNDLELQQRYGQLLCRVFSGAYRQLEPAQERVRPGGGKLRVGFVSAHFRDHSVTKTHGAWLTDIDRTRFEVIGFHLGEISDERTEGLARSCQLRELAGADFPGRVAAILDAELDILVYLDIGMDSRVQGLAALRLAPVQCSTWGHPVTSGMPSIDYYLSSELMEPDDGAEHYTEKLIRLPNLSVRYPHPDVSAAEPPPRLPCADGDETVYYLCAQNLLKLLPQYDAIYPRIAARRPGCRLLFIGGASSSVVIERFRSRLRRAFAEHELDADDYCSILPGMSHRQFLGLNRAAHVILDSIAWSGCNSTLEGIAFDKPVVTMPTAMMRGRHGYGILKRLGLEENIADDVASYVDIAARLGGDPERRRDVSERTRRAKARVYDDRSAIRGLEESLLEVFETRSAR